MIREAVDGLENMAPMPRVNAVFLQCFLPKPPEPFFLPGIHEGLFPFVALLGCLGQQLGAADQEFGQVAVKTEQLGRRRRGSIGIVCHKKGCLVLLG